MSVDLLHLWGQMGYFAKGIVLILAIMSIWSLTIMIQKFIQFRRAQAETRKFAPQFSRAIQEENLDQAIALAEKNKKSHVARVVGEALAEVKPLLRDRATITAADINSAERAVERQMLITLADFKRGIGILATVGSTAPFVGLLGTTMGIVNAFTGMASQGASGGLGRHLGRYRRGAHHDGVRSAGRHPGGVGVQLLHDQDREPHGRDDVHLEGTDRLPDQERRQRVRPFDLHQGVPGPEGRHRHRSRAWLSPVPHRLLWVRR